MTRKDVVKSETLTVSTTAVGLTGTYLVAPVNKVFVHFEGTARYWRSTLAPTSTNGIPVEDKTQKEFDISEAVGLRMIRTGGADIKVHVEYIAEKEQ